MKKLLIAVIFLCLVGVVACEDMVIGDYPFECIGDTVYLFPLPDDWYCIVSKPGTCSVTVQRIYDDVIEIEFNDTFYDINHIHIVNIPGPGNDDD